MEERFPKQVDPEESDEEVRQTEYDIKKSLDEAQNKIFEIFDLNGNGIVDMEEVTVAVCMLCRGSIVSATMCDNVRETKSTPSLNSSTTMEMEN